MKKKFRKIISLCICLILISTAITPVFALSQKNTNKPSDNLTMLDVKTKYNPLRTNSENNYDLYEMEPGEFNDENVKFERVTYYDEFNNKIKEYTGEAALNHLYEIEKIQPSLTTSSEIMNMMNNQTLIKNEDDRFERRVIVSYIDSKATTKVIRKKPISIDDLNASRLIFEAGLAFTKPVYSIIASAISQFLCICQPKTVPYFNRKLGQLKQKN